MNLAEFLLARIAEDEADAMVGWRWKVLPAGEYTRLQARVLVECEAKRRLVKDLVYFMEGDYAPWNEGFLRLLALPYADHPDYQPEWKP